MHAVDVPNPHGRPPAVRFAGVGKSFGNFTAVTDVDLDISAGTIHAFVGQNGAGKSTLLGIVAGRLAATRGTIEVFGAPIETGSPRAARASGVVAIYQELTTVPSLSACANVFLGQNLSRFGMIREGAMRTQFLQLCRRLDVRIAPETEARLLSVANRQLLEIMRALQANAGILLLDEPTAALPPPEREVLFGRMRELRQAGVTMVLVSHNLDEVLSIADAISVFRDGRLIATAPTAQWSKQALVKAMLGHSSQFAAPGKPVSIGPVHLRAEAVTVPGKIEDITFEIRRGEIVGVGGLVGSGRTTLLRALAGMEPRASGKLWIAGMRKPWPRDPAVALALGIALLPEDRKAEALFPAMTAQENIIVSDFGAVARMGFLSARRATDQAKRLARDCGFDAGRIHTLAGALSGGNQQKLLMARWQHSQPRLLLADEPTRGIDIGAKAEILNKLRHLSNSGLAVLLVSSELEEISDYSDRILVLSAGRMAGELQRGASVAAILHAAFAVEPADA